MVGYLGAPVAEEYGGRGLDYVGYALIVEQIGRADSSARTVVSVVTSLVCKLYATEAVVECANPAIQVHGGSGYVDDYPVERYLRDAPA